MSSESENPDQLIPEETDVAGLQFVLNELPAEQRSAFESRLEDDELACLAVSRATQLSLAMQISCEEFHATCSGDQGEAGGQVTDRSSRKREVLAEQLRAQVAADRAKSEIRQQRVRKLSTMLACGIVCAAVVASLQQSGWLDRSSSRHDGVLSPVKSVSPAKSGAPEEQLGYLRCTPRAISNRNS